MYEENAVIHALCSRRSVRSYDSSRPVEQEKLDAILAAGQYAPTGMNRMPTKFVVVRNREVLQQLSKQNAAIMGKEDVDPFYGAPVAIAVLVDASVHTWVEDGSLAIGAMLDAAYAVGLGSCWIHRAKETFDSAAGKEMGHSGYLSRCWILYCRICQRRIAGGKTEKSRSDYLGGLMF